MRGNSASNGSGDTGVEYEAQLLGKSPNRLPIGGEMAESVERRDDITAGDAGFTLT